MKITNLKILGSLLAVPIILSLRNLSLYCQSRNFDSRNILRSLQTGKTWHLRRSNEQSSTSINFIFLLNFFILRFQWGQKCWLKKLSRKVRYCSNDNGYLASRDKNVKIVYFDTGGQNRRLAHCECENAAWTRGQGRKVGSRVSTAFLHAQWANRPGGLMYRTIFFFTNLCEPKLAHCLQTSKMRRKSTLLNSCQHNDINIVTVSIARRRWTAPLKPRRPRVQYFTL